jgi:hypothetical protein
VRGMISEAMLLSVLVCMQMWLRVYVWVYVCAHAHAHTCMENVPAHMLS